MEERCPFCYSNRVVKHAGKDGKEWRCLDCEFEFEDSYVLYANPRRKRVREER